MQTITENRRAVFTEKCLEILCAVLLLVTLGVFSYANIARYTAHMDADIAGEAALAKEVARNRMRTPSTWYASTEKRVIAPANIAAVFYMITSNMNLSMGLACNLCLWILVAVMGVYYRKMGMRGAVFWATLELPLVITVNLNSALEMYALYAGYYIPVFIGMYVSLFWYYVCRTRAMKSADAGTIALKKQYILYALPVIVAVLLGLQGMRGVLMVLLPLMAVESIRAICARMKDRSTESPKPDKLSFFQEGRMTAFLVICTVSSYLIARLSTNGLTETSRNLRHAPEKFMNEVLPAIGQLFTPQVNPVYVGCVAIIMVAGIMFPLIVLRLQLKKTETDAAWAILPLTVSVFVMVAAMTLTTTDVAPRYAVMVFFAAAGGYGLLLQHLYEAGNRYRRMRYAVVFPVIVCAVISIGYNWNHLICPDTTQEDTYAQIADTMVAHNVTKGYATFDWANTITVVSNDTVQVRPVNNMKDLEGAKWLANATWYPPYADAGQKVFYITTSYTDDMFMDSARDRNIQILETIRINDFILYMTDIDYTVWKE